MTGINGTEIIVAVTAAVIGAGIHAVVVGDAMIVVKVEEMAYLMVLE